MHTYKHAYTHQNTHTYVERYTRFNRRGQLPHSLSLSFSYSMARVPRARALSCIDSLLHTLCLSRFTSLTLSLFLSFWRTRALSLSLSLTCIQHGAAAASMRARSLALFCFLFLSFSLSLSLSCWRAHACARAPIFSSHSLTRIEHGAATRLQEHTHSFVLELSRSLLRSHTHAHSHICI